MLSTSDVEFKSHVSRFVGGTFRPQLNNPCFPNLVSQLQFLTSAAFLPIDFGFLALLVPGKLAGSGMYLL